MPNEQVLLLGEFSRSLDDRYRVSLPSELADGIASTGESEPQCLLAKERPGCLSLWNSQRWQQKLDEGVGLLRGKMAAGRMEGRVAEIQALGRLLSTRHRQVPLTGRGRLVIPDSFRDFLGVQPGEDVMLVGAAVCIEIWNPTAWNAAIANEMPGFRQLFDQLSG
jgi:MraZ protein